jgi:hypothetical protein
MSARPGAPRDEHGGAAASSVCSLLQLEHFADERGWLNVAQVGGALPFVARRFYFIGDVPEGVTRGLHGHRSIQQLFVAVRGRVHVELRARGVARQIVLDRPDMGLHLTASIWSSQRFEAGAILLVLASGEYDPAGYIHDPLQMTGDVGHE